MSEFRHFSNLDKLAGECIWIFTAGRKEFRISSPRSIPSRQCATPVAERALTTLLFLCVSSRWSMLRMSRLQRRQPYRPWRARTAAAGWTPSRRRCCCCRCCWPPRSSTAGSTDGTERLIALERGKIEYLTIPLQQSSTLRSIISFSACTGGQVVAYNYCPWQAKDSCRLWNVTRSSSEWGFVVFLFFGDCIQSPRLRLRISIY